MGAGALQDEAKEREDASGQRRVLVSGARARTLQGFIAASREVFGEETHRRMCERVASHVLDALTLDGEAWVPVDDVIEWCEASLCDEDEGRIRAFVDVMMNHGFGKVRRVLLQIATPHGVLRRAGELWREEFTDGRLVAYATSPNTAIATLYEHRFLESPLLRAVVAESFRYTLQLSGAADVNERHGSDGDGPLIVRLSWR